MSEAARSQPELLVVQDEEALQALLEKHGFDTSTWGDGTTKSVWALWHEIEEGESEMLQSGAELIRRTHVAGVDVVANLASGERYHLVEEKQVYRGGGERQRNLIVSLGEKMKPAEDTEAAVRRAIEEELGIHAIKKLEVLGEQSLQRPSATFKGLSSQLLLRLARAEIFEEDFKPDGYVEHQADKSVYFTWERTAQ